MNGLLIDTGRFWLEAEVQVLGELGVPLTPAMASQVPAGIREDEVVVYRHKQYAWEGASVREVANSIEQRVAELVHKDPISPRPGNIGVNASCHFREEA